MSATCMLHTHLKVYVSKTQAMSTQATKYNTISNFCTFPCKILLRKGNNDYSSSFAKWEHGT